MTAVLRFPGAFCQESAASARPHREACRESRRSGIKFEGFTWPERFIVLTTPYDFEAGRGY